MHSQSRRGLLKTTAGVGLACLAKAARSAPAEVASEPLFNLQAIIKEPVRIKSLQMLRLGEEHVVRATSTSGAIGYAVTNQHAGYLPPLFHQRVVPAFLGRDARDIEALIDGAYVHSSNYKLAGLPLWCCISYAEFAVLDMLGRIASMPVGVLLGGKPLRTEVPMYLSSTDRESTPEEEVALFESALEKTGVKAVKYKVGGRMSGNADASAGRSETLIALIRKRLGDKITYYADANGSFDARKGIEVGRQLEAHGVAIYEEPCPFEDYASTQKVTRALKKVMVAGGEQDHSWYRFQEVVKNRVLDMVQPDLSYNGGFVRTVRVARLAARAKLPISPHCPQFSTMLYTLHLASFTPNMGAFQEFHVRRVGQAPWYAPDLQLHNGALKIPSAPGLGLAIDESSLKKAVLV